MKVTPRIAQYFEGINDDELDALIFIPPFQVDIKGPVDQVTKELEHAMCSTVLPDSQFRKLIRNFLSLARARASACWDTDEKYLKGMYSKDRWGPNKPAAVCFTGLSGVGKSQLLHALRRVLLSESFFHSPKGYSNLPIVPMWFMTMEKGDGLNNLLREYVDPEWSTSNGQAAENNRGKDWKVPVLMRAAENAAWLYSTAINAVDEFQFISSSDAHARAASVLLKLQSLGPLLAYCANFSLVHKLKRRRSEDVDRLLSHHIVMHPFSSGSLELSAYLKNLQRIAPHLYVFDCERDADQIHLYTGGIRRKIIHLLVVAARIALNASPVKKVGCAELVLAYRSAEYAVHREAVEILIRQEVSGELVREDLWCPFGSVSSSRTNVTEATAIIQAFEKRTEDALLQSALTPAEAAAHAAVAPAEKSRVTPAKVLRFKAGKATKADLLVGAEMLNKIT